MRAEMARHKPPRGVLDVKLHRGGLVDCEFLVHFLHLQGHDTGVDLDRLIAAGHWLEEVLERELPAHLLRAAPVGRTVPASAMRRAAG